MALFGINNNAVAVIGGGVSGLCAAIKLQELGYQAIIIESGSYPSHKVCGEFISPESLPFLNSLGIQTCPIPRARFFLGSNSIEFPFSKAAGGLSHISLDPQLLEKAVNAGAKVLTDTKVVHFEPKRSPEEYHTIILSNGEKLEVPLAIIATGRIPSLGKMASTKPPTAQFVGFKAHFKGIDVTDSLEMHLTAGGYLGISPIEDGQVNIACLVRVGSLSSEADRVERFVETLAEQNPILKRHLQRGTNVFGKWLQTEVPAFGFRKTPQWPDVYFIGDAALAIPPASGQGISLAIEGGLLAALAIKAGNPEDFQKQFRKAHFRQMAAARALHYLLMNPLMTRLAFAGSAMIPALPKWIHATVRA